MVNHSICSDAQVACNRGDWIRTSDLFVPNEARYQAALHPVEVLKNGRERIRTSEGVRQQIYSLPPLATWVHARIVSSRAASPR